MSPRTPKGTEPPAGQIVVLDLDADPELAAGGSTARRSSRSCLFFGSAVDVFSRRGRLLGRHLRRQDLKKNHYESAALSADVRDGTSGELDPIRLGLPAPSADGVRVFGMCRRFCHVLLCLLDASDEQARSDCVASWPRRGQPDITQLNVPHEGVLALRSRPGILCLPRPFGPRGVFRRGEVEHRRRIGLARQAPGPEQRHHPAHGAGTIRPRMTRRAVDFEIRQGPPRG
jgi:hypothetical protein